VHGGAHGGWCYQRVARILRSDGHDVYTPTMTGVGERSHLVSADVDLDLHIRDIVAVLHYEDLLDVMLVGHSYGGMVITGVAVIEAVRPDGKVFDGVELVLLPSPDAGLLYGVTDPDDLAWMAERLSGHPWKCFEQKLDLRNEPALWAIPQYHIVCTSTLATRDPEVMGKARAEGRLWDIDTGHDLMITEPEAVAETLLRVAAE
jgi:Alpha/beta hydrolase family